MKKRIMSIILVIMVVLSPMMFVNAQGHIDHPGSENCIYSCVLDEINITVPEVTSQNVSGHIDHPGSENCIYSCILDNATTAVSESSVVLTSEPEVLIDENLRNFIAEYLDIAAENVDLDAIRATVEVLAEDQSLSDFCLHQYFTACQGVHSTPSYCIVACTRIAICSICGEVGFITMSESFHSWVENSCGRTCNACGTSESNHSWGAPGWCGQTCTNCGKIELFHGPGGCWFCS